MLGVAPTAKDWGLFPNKEVTMDASAGIAMGSRQGLGRVDAQRHSFQWVQRRRRFVSRRRRRLNVGRYANGTEP